MASCFTRQKGDRHEFGYGLVAIKCPFTLRNLTPEEACADPNFYCHLVNGEAALKKDHPYYYQVQGQLRLTGLKLSLIHI